MYDVGLSKCDRTFTDATILATTPHANVADAITQVTGTADVMLDCGVGLILIDDGTEIKCGYAVPAPSVMTTYPILKAITNFIADCLFRAVYVDKTPTTGQSTYACVDIECAPATGPGTACASGFDATMFPVVGGADYATMAALDDAFAAGPATTPNAYCYGTQ